MADLVELKRKFHRPPLKMISRQAVESSIRVIPPREMERTKN